MFALIREMSLRHLTRAPLRSLLVVFGIALGVAVFVASKATSQSLLASFEELIERVAGRADLTVTGNQSAIDGALLAQIAETEGVEHAAATLEVTASCAEDQMPLLVLGVDFLGDTYFLPFTAEKGEQNVVDDPLAFANDPTAILISKKLAVRRNLKRDSPLALLTSDGVKTFYVRGILDDSGPAASFGGQVAVMFLDAAQVSFGRGTLVDRIDVAIKKGQDPSKVARRINAAIGSYARVERSQQAGERLRAVVRPLRYGLELSGIVALLVGMFIIYNAIGISVTQRRKEVGLVRA
jgi:putative ABC transport system permease protein